jgi:hypothetical protein
MSISRAAGYGANYSPYAALLLLLCVRAVKTSVRDRAAILLPMMMALSTRASSGKQ